MLIGAAGPVLADSEGAGFRGTTEVSAWTPVGTLGSAAQQADAWVPEGPIAAGSMPTQVVKSQPSQLLNMDVAEQNWSPELRGRANIQVGP